MKSSKYKGVYVIKPRICSKRRIKFIYRAEVYANGKCYKVGLFDNEIESAKAYDRKCIELGKYKGLNFFKKI